MCDTTSEVIVPGHMWDTVSELSVLDTYVVPSLWSQPLDACMLSSHYLPLGRNVLAWVYRKETDPVYRLRHPASSLVKGGKI